MGASATDDYENSGPIPGLDEVLLGVSVSKFAIIINEQINNILGHTYTWPSDLKLSRACVLVTRQLIFIHMYLNTF